MVFLRHTMQHYRPVLSTIRSRRVMREEGATKRDDVGAGR